MQRENGESPRAALLRLSSGYRTTQAIYVVAKLGIADLLASGPKDAAALAREVQADPDKLFRLLRLLASIGVLTRDGPERFGLAPMGELLKRGTPGSMVDMVIFQGEEPYRSCAELLHTVRTGETAFDHLYGMGHFSYLAKHPEASERFHRAMASSVQAGGDPLAGYDLRPHKVLVDVGGGQGELMAHALRANPSLQGILFDLPEAVAGARARLNSAGVSDRCEIQTGSAFDAVPSGGDVYLMSRILHDWPDDRALVLLRNCHQAMGQDGVLLLREAVLPDPGAPVALLQRDLMMMIMVGGRERTEDDWRALLHQGGLGLALVRRTGTGLDIIEARPG